MRAGGCWLALLAVCVVAQDTRLSGIHNFPSSVVHSEKSLSIAKNQHEESVFWLFRVSYLWYSGLGSMATLLMGLLVSVVTGATDPTQVPIDLISPPVITLLNKLPKKAKSVLRLPARLGAERRRSSSVRPPSMANDKDTRRRRRLSEMAGGVFYSDAGVAYGHDNLALEHAIKDPEDYKPNHSP